MLSINIITKNEEHIIEKCLKSIINLADEIIVVDTGSTDNTISICKKYTDKLYTFKWNNDFSEVRNYAKSKSNGDWILSLDSDEVIYKNHINLIKQYLNKDIDAYIVTTKNFTNNPQTANWKINSEIDEIELGNNSSGWFPSDKIRLFRNKKEYYYEGKVHELLQNSLNKNNAIIKEADFFIYHYGYLIAEQTPEIWERKLNLYEKLGETKLKESNNIKYIFELAKHKRAVNKLNEAKKMFIQCINKNYRLVDCYNELGLILSKLNNEQEAIKYIKKAIDLNPNFVSSYANLGYIYYILEDYEKAIYFYQKSLEIDKTHLNSYYNLGLIYRIIKKYNDSIKYFEKCLKLFSDYKPAITELIKLNFFLNNYEQCNILLKKLHKKKLTKDLEEIKKILIKKKEEKRCNEDKNNFNKGIELFNKKEYKKAIIKFRKTLSINPNFCEAYKYIIKILEKLNQPNKIIMEKKRYEKCLQKIK